MCAFLRRRAAWIALALLAATPSCKRPVVGRDFAGASITELTVSPEHARQGVPITISFRLDGGLQGAVSYTIASQSAECVPTRAPDGRFECVHPGVSRQSYPQGAVDVTVRAKDRVGKESTATARLTLDFDCPQFTSLSITPPIGSPGTVAVVEIETNELLGEPPIVSRGGMLWEAATGSGTAYRVEHPVGDSDGAAALDVVVRISDLAGNTSGDCGIDGRLPFGVDREVPVVNAPLVELYRDIPGTPARISADPGAFSDDVEVSEVRVLEDDGAGGLRLVASLVPAANGSLPETSLGETPSGRVLLVAVDGAGNESPAAYVRERWRLSAGDGTSRNSAVRTAVRYTPAPPRSPSMENRTRELATRIFEEDTQSAQVDAHVGFRPIGTLPAGYRDMTMIATGYDPASRSIVGFGGRVIGFQGQTDDTLIIKWNELTQEYENTVITAVPGQSPVARTGVDIAFDGSGCGVMFGGERLDRWLNDLWRICSTPSGWQWTELTGTNFPEPRFTPLVWDPMLRRYAISSGFSRFSTTDMYFLDPSPTTDGWRWVQVTGLPDRLKNSDRLFHAFYYQPSLRGYGLLLGIVVPFFEGGAFWSFSDGGWTPSAVPVELVGRTGFGFDYDVARSLLVVWGHDTEEIAEFDPDTWLLAGDPRSGAQAWRRTNLNPSVARGWPSIVYDSDRESTIVFGGARFVDLVSVPPVVEEMVLSPSFPYLQASLDLAAERPVSIESLDILVNATGVGDGDGVGPGTNRAGGVAVLLYDHDASAWREVAAVETPPAGDPVSIPARITDRPERFVSFDGVVPVTVVTRWPATEDADARLDVDLVDGELVLAPQVPRGAIITRFDVAPPQVVRGQTATITWSVTNAPDGVTILAGGTVMTESGATEGTFMVTPAADTTYELRARNAAEGDATRTRQIDVRPAEPPPLVISFDPAAIAGPRGDTMRLSWVTERASSIRLLRGGTEILATSTVLDVGSFDAALPLDPTVTSTSFVLEVSNESGVERRQAEVRLAATNVVRGPSASASFSDGISFPGEADLFMVVMPEPGYIEAGVYVPFAPQCTAGSDTVLTLYDGAFEYVGYDDDDGPGSCSLITRTDNFALVPAGTYFLEVTEWSSSDVIPAYILEVATFPIECGNGIVEPGEGCDDNNTTSGDGCDSTCRFEAAGIYTAPTDGLVVFPTSIPTAGIERAYQIEVVSTSFVRMETFVPDVATGCPNPNDTFIELRDESMTNIIDTDDDGGVGYCSLISTLLSPGTYFLIVRELGNNGVLPALDVVFDVTLGLQFEVEPNDTLPQATSFGTVPAGTLSQAFTAAISPVGDDDFYSFTIAAPSNVTITTLGDINVRTSCSGLDTTMTLYNAAQLELAFNDDAIGGCAQLDGIGGFDPELVALPAGTYYLRIQDYGDNTVIPSYFIDVEVQ